MEISLVIEVSVPEPGFTRMALYREESGKYIVRCLLLDGTYEQGRLWSRSDVLCLAYRTLHDWSTEQATEVAEFLRNDATEAEWTLAALTVL